MGTVWLAEHITLQSLVAVKCLSDEVANDPQSLERFMREAQAAAALRSPHVVQILDYGVDENTPFIAMELLEGEPLVSVMEREGKLSPTNTAILMTQVARAIGRAHEAGIVHRDIKPDNIYLVQNDDEVIAKVLDFGVAKSTQDFGRVKGTLTQTGAMLGTPFYMSPEQAEAREVDHRSDLWSFAVIAYECLLGKRPFNGDSVGSLVLSICSRPLPVPSQDGEVPEGFDAWFAKGCARDPADRFQSAREAAAALKVVCGLHTRSHALGSELVAIASADIQALDSVNREAATVHGDDVLKPRFAPGTGFEEEDDLDDSARVRPLRTPPKLDFKIQHQIALPPAMSMTISQRLAKRKSALLAGGAVALCLLLAGVVFATNRTPAPAPAAPPIPSVDTRGPALIEIGRKRSAADADTAAPTSAQSAAPTPSEATSSGRGINKPGWKASSSAAAAPRGTAAEPTPDSPASPPNPGGKRRVNVGF
jgi:serine/threonine-protein kinase